MTHPATPTLNTALRPLRTLAVSCAALLLPTAVLAERTIMCSDYMLTPSLEPMTFGRITITQDDAGTVTITDMDENTHPLAVRRRGLGDILFTQTTDNARDGDRFTVVVASEVINDGMHAPVTWLIDWQEPSLHNTALFLSAPLDTSTDLMTADWVIRSNFICVPAQ